MGKKPTDLKLGRDRRKPYLWAYAFLLPSFLVLGTFSYWPLVQTIMLSVQQTDLFGNAAGFAGFDNYKNMFTSSDFLRTLLITVIFVVATVVLKLIAGLAIAIPLSTRLAGTWLIRPIVLIPMAFSVAVASVAFKAMFAPGTGVFDQLLSMLGIVGPDWLTSPKWALISTIIVDVWVGIGMATLLLMAALDSIPSNIMEAASIDGAGTIRKIFSMQLPLITPTVFFIVVTQSVAALREFTVFNVLTGGGPNGATTTLTYDLYSQAFGASADYGASAARGVVLMVIVALLTVVQFRFGERKVNY